MKRVALSLGGWLVGIGLALGGSQSPAVAAGETGYYSAIDDSGQAPSSGAQWSPSRPRPRTARRWTSPTERAQVQQTQSRVVNRTSGRPTLATHPMQGRTIETQIHLQEGETLVSVDNQPVGGPVRARTAPRVASQPFAEEVGPAPVVEEFQGGMGPYPDQGGGDCGCECDGGGGDDCGGACEACCGCDSECGGSLCHKCGNKICFCFDMCWCEDLGVFGGVHAFKGPLDGGLNGNFGFHEGLNLGLPVIPSLGIGAQIGVQATHSNFEGAFPNTTFFEEDTRQQTFVTAGFFHRALCGLQWGLVGDWLHDDYYLDAELSQVRGEVSLVGPCHNELGFWFAAHSRTDFSGSVVSRDIFAAFYRRQFQNGADARFWGGATDDSDGVVGGDFHIPLSCCCALEAGATWLIPHEGRGEEGAASETWGLAINLVLYPGHKMGCRCRNRCWGEVRQYRPLVNVADNGSLLVDFE